MASLQFDRTRKQFVIAGVDLPDSPTKIRLPRGTSKAGKRSVKCTRLGMRGGHGGCMGRVARGVRPEGRGPGRWLGSPRRVGGRGSRASGPVSTGPAAGPPGGASDGRRCV